MSQGTVFLITATVFGRYKFTNLQHAGMIINRSNGHKQFWEVQLFKSEVQKFPAEIEYQDESAGL